MIYFFTGRKIKQIILLCHNVELIKIFNLIVFLIICIHCFLLLLISYNE